MSYVHCWVRFYIIVFVCMYTCVYIMWDVYRQLINIWIVNTDCFSTWSVWSIWQTRMFCLICCWAKNVLFYCSSGTVVAPNSALLSICMTMTPTQHRVIWHKTYYWSATQLSMDDVLGSAHLRNYATFIVQSIFSYNTILVILLVRLTTCMQSHKNKYTQKIDTCTSIRHNLTN